MKKIYNSYLDLDEIPRQKIWFPPKNIESWNKNGQEIIGGIIHILTGKKRNIAFDSKLDFHELANNGLKGSIEYGDIDEMPKLKIGDNNKTNIYEVLTVDQDNKVYINLDSEVTTKNRATLIQQFAKCSSYFSLQIGNTNYIITIYAENKKDDFYSLPHEEEFKNLLFGLKPNTSIDEVITLLEYSLGRLGKFNKVEILKRIKKKDSWIVTDQILLKNGELQKFKQTKKNKDNTYIVSIDENDDLDIEILDIDLNDINDLNPNYEVLENTFHYVKKYPKRSFKKDPKK